MMTTLAAALAELDPGASPASRLASLVAARADRLPMPGRGATLTRWRALADVAAHDLSLAKLYEGHTDALAIFAELGAAHAEGAVWGVWAAEAPQARALIEQVDGDRVRLGGAKGWCSGAEAASHALLTATDREGGLPQLVSIDLAQPAVRVVGERWCAVGMAGAAALDVEFDGAEGRLVGAPGAYLSRPGFWHGGAGIAACWYGGARFIGEALRRAVAEAPVASVSAFKLAALGQVDVALAAAAAALREAAAWIDAHPAEDARRIALRARLCAEHAATRVLHEAGRALGAAPFCRDARFARAAADLPVFIRQSHAERDLAALGERVASAAEADAWTL
jgi:hypothetical protein